MRRRLALLALPLLAAMAPPPAAAADVYGRWQLKSGVAQVEIAPCADPARGPVCGRVVWLKEARNPDGSAAPSVEEVRDVNNRDPALRGRRLLGLEFLWGFRPAADEPGTFEDGTIYNAEDGKTYKARLSLLEDGRLRLRGYVGVPQLGKSQTWTRVR